MRLRESPECEERDRGQTHLGLFVTKDIRGSVWAVSLRGIPPKSAAWGSQQVRRGHSTALARLPFLCQSWQHRGDKDFLFFLLCSEAAVLSRGIWGLCRVPLRPGSFL